MLKPTYYILFILFLSNTLFGQIKNNPINDQRFCPSYIPKLQPVMKVITYNTYIDKSDTLKNLENINNLVLFTKDGIIEIAEVLDTNITKSYIKEYFTIFQNLNKNKEILEWQNNVCEKYITIELLETINKKLNSIINLEIFSHSDLYEITYCYRKQNSIIYSIPYEKFKYALNYFQYLNDLTITFGISAESLEKLGIKTW